MWYYTKVSRPLSEAVAQRIDILVLLYSYCMASGQKTFEFIVNLHATICNFRLLSLSFIVSRVNLNLFRMFDPIKSTWEG